MNSVEFGSFVALAVHDTSSVIGTALEYSTESVEVAATLKVARTLWLIPVSYTHLTLPTILLV